MTTPMMKQYRDAKGAHPDAVLFFRMGDFYELFYDDAEKVSRLLGITLTSRSKDASGVRIPMAGVPVRSLDQNLARLLRLGQKVAICDQIQDPRDAKGIVDRAVTRVVTPGTLTEENLLSAKDNNYLLALAPGRGRVGLAWVDLSTGSFRLQEVEARLALDEIARIAPAECLVPEAETKAANDPVLRGLEQACRAVITRIPGWILDHDYAERTLLDHLGVSTLEGFGCKDTPLGVRAAGAILHYLAETQKTALSHIRRIEIVRAGERMLLDAATQACLELVRPMREGSRDGTLLSVLDRTLTSMGGRLLKSWLLAPLLDVEAIRTRQAAVNELVENGFLRADLRKALLSVYDLERIATKISTQRANARDLLALRQSLDAVPELVRLTRDCVSELLASVAKTPLLEDLCDELTRGIVDEPPLVVKDGGMIREGYHGPLDEIRSLAANAKEWIADFQRREVERTGISTLKVGFNKVFGYYVEITHAHGDRIPEDYQRKQTLKNAERYITPELKEYETKVLTADERARELEYDLFQALREKAASRTRELQEIAAVVARADVLAALADVAERNGYVAPVVDDGDEIKIVAGRHPVLEAGGAGGTFVPNDTHLGGDAGRVLILTGPNMAGKSTYIRQAALLVLMAQIGSFVPASSARIGAVDRVFTRMGAADELFLGKSTFMVEMTETANILNNGTRKSLIILDEVGRGTSTFDGLSIAWAVTEHICRKIGAKTLFATHYHELTDLADQFPEVENANVLVREWGDEVVFLHRIGPGATDKSYGIHVARLAGLPGSVVERARELLHSFEEEHARLQGRIGAGLEDAPREGYVTGRSRTGLVAEPATTVPGTVLNTGATPVRQGVMSADEGLTSVPGTVVNTVGGGRRPRRAAQLTLFPVVDDPVVERLRTLDVEAMGPERAREALVALKRMLEEPAGSGKES